MFKRLTILAVPVVLGLCCLLTAEENKAAHNVWLTDLKEAQKLSKQTGRPILANFTGSDWCGWCIKLHKDVFSTAEFQAWAKESVVLLEVDFPAKKPLPQNLKQQNESLKNQFQINGYPTILFMDDASKELGRIVGYRPADKWMPEAKKLAGKPKTTAAPK